MEIVSEFFLTEPEHKSGLLVFLISSPELKGLRMDLLENSD